MSRLVSEYRSGHHLTNSCFDVLEQTETFKRRKIITPRKPRVRQTDTGWQTEAKYADIFCVEVTSDRLPGGPTIRKVIYYLRPLIHSLLQKATIRSTIIGGGSKMAKYVMWYRLRFVIFPPLQTLTHQGTT